MSDPLRVSPAAMGLPDLRKRSLVWTRSGPPRRARAFARLCVFSLLSYWLASVLFGSGKGARTVVWGRVSDEILEAEVCRLSLGSG